MFTDEEQVPVLVFHALPGPLHVVWDEEEGNGIWVQVFPDFFKKNIFLNFMVANLVISSPEILHCLPEVPLVVGVLGRAEANLHVVDVVLQCFLNIEWGKFFF